MKQIFKAEDNERRRIAQELHDDTIQTLLIMANDADSLSSVEVSGVRDVSERIKGTLLHMIEDLRRLTLDLSPSILDNLGLVPALRWLAANLSQESNVEMDIAIEGELRRFDRETEVNIFRIVQEALNNVRKHSGATKVRLALVFSPESLQITVQDNGKGFDLAEKLSDYSLEGKLGLIGIQQRAEFLKGTLRLFSRPYEGTTILLDVKC